MPDVNELEQMLTAIGWKLKTLKEPTTSSNGRFVATIEPPDGGQPISRDGDTPERALGNALMFAQRRNSIRAFASVQKVAHWDTPWRERLEDIAQAYADAPVYDDKAVQAWQALARESALQADAIRNQLRIQETDDPHPYRHHGEMIHDVHHNGKLVVSRAHSTHPVWTQQDLVNYRIAHDVLGHSQTGGDFGWDGEVKAVAAHMPMLSPLARRALFAEELGRSAYTIRNGSHGFGPQKIALLEDELGPVEKMNGEHVFVPHGKLVYPQNILGVGQGEVGPHQNPETGIWQHAASVKRADAVGAWQPPHTSTSLEMAPRNVYDSIDPSPEYPDILPGTKVDPNMYASTPSEFVNPNITPAGHPSDYLLRGNMEDNVGKFDQPEDPFISMSPEEQRKTIRNAFAIVILSPKKSLTWNAAHYQAIKDLDSSATSADLFDAIMKERNYHNSFRAEGKARDMFDMQGLSPAGMNRATHDRTIKKLHDYILRTTGHSDAKAWELAKKTIMEMFNQIEPHAMMALEKENEMRQQAINPATQEVELNAVGRPNKRREIEPNGMRLRLKTWEMVNAWLDSVMQGYKIPKKQPELAPEPQPLGGGLPVQMARAINGWLEKTAAEGGPNETTGADIKGRYGGVLFDHLEAISRLSQPVLESMRQYAVKDITEDGGKGFIFRAGCVALNVPGIGPKTASFAWLLIHPQTSELGIIDTHAARGLGFEDEKALNDRTYYIAERMQRAAKDSTGYADVPLGKYHWGFWDMLRTPGVSSDHRMLRPRNPLPWDDPSIYHGADEIVSRAGQPLFHGAPEFEAARPKMEAVKAAAQAELRTKMLPTHYAQGLLPEQPPEEYRAEPFWKMQHRYTAPAWIDPTTMRPYPEMTVPFESPSVRAASVGWKETGWMPADPNSPHGGYANSHNVVCPECNSRIIDGAVPGTKCNNCGHVTDGTEEPVISGDFGSDPRMDQIDEAYRAANPPGPGSIKRVKDWLQDRAASKKQSVGWEDAANDLMGKVQPGPYMEEARGNSVAAQQLMAHDLEQQHGYDKQIAWMIAGELIRNHELQGGPGKTDMSEFEGRPTTDPEHALPEGNDWGPTEEFPEDFNPAQSMGGWEHFVQNDQNPLEWHHPETGEIRSFPNEEAMNREIHGVEPSEDQSHFDPQRAELLRGLNDAADALHEDPEGFAPDEDQTERQPEIPLFQPGDRVQTRDGRPGTVMHHELQQDDPDTDPYHMYTVKHDTGQTTHGGEGAYQILDPMTGGPNEVPWNEQEQNYYRQYRMPYNPEDPRTAGWQVVAWPDPTKKYQPGGFANMPRERNEEGFDICPICGEPIIPGQHPRDVCPNANYRRISTNQINFSDGSQAGDHGLDFDDFEDFAAYHNKYDRDNGELDQLPTEETDRLKREWEKRHGGWQEV